MNYGKLFLINQTYTMKIALITTIDHNVGDDFVREGIKYLFSSFLPNAKFSSIHKHSPVSVRYGLERLRNRTAGKIVDNLLPHSITPDKIRECDILVQCGAPVYWHNKASHCAENEWYESLITKRFCRWNNQKPKFLLNIAAGTCQPYHSSGHEILNCPSCVTYIKEFFDLSTLTTARDILTQELLERLGMHVEKLPCTSIFAPNRFGIVGEKRGRYIVMNYMPSAGHYEFDQNIDARKWQNVFVSLYHEFARHDEVVIVCHNHNELRATKRILNDANIFYASNDYRAYIEFYSHAKFGIVNRVHSAFLMAGLGKPSIIVGNDTRAKMADLINIENFFVNEVYLEFLRDKANKLAEEINSFRDEVFDTKEKSQEKYLELLKGSL